MQPSMVVTDIDGTLLSDQGTIGSYTGKSLAYLYHDLEIPIVLATGRPPRDVLEIVEQLDFNPLCICANGAVLYDSARKDLELISVLSADDVRYCIQHLSARIPGAGFAIEPPQLDASFFGDQSYFHPYDSHPPVVRLDSIDNLFRPAVKLLISVAGCESRILAQRVEQAIDYAYEVSYFHMTDLVEIAQKGVNKATGLTYAAQAYNLPIQQVIAFGDMNNDTELIQSVWRGVAMENASPELLAFTSYHTLSNNHDGIAHELSKYWPELHRFSTLSSENSTILSEK